MDYRGFNGEFKYQPEYETTEEDLAGVAEVFPEADWIRSIADLQFGEDRAILVSVHYSDQSNEDVCLIYKGQDQTHFYEPEGDVPLSTKQIAESMKSWEVGELTHRRSKLWGAVKKLSDRGEEIANFTKREEDSLVEVISERETENGMVEMKVEYDERLVEIVSDHYEVPKESVSKQLISDFISVSFYKEVHQNNV